MTRRAALPLIVLTGLVLLLGLTVWFAPRISAVQFTPEQEAQIIRSLRLPRLYLAMIAGAGLALAGMTLQALFRNPLATPFTLGISSGASLALAVALACGLSATWLGGAGRSAVALGGALVVMALVYGIARLRSTAPTSTLLLAGVSINFICGAGIILTQYLAQTHEARQLIYWLLGSVEASDPQTQRAMAWMAIVLAVTAVVLWWRHRDLDLLMMGELLAASRGVEIARTRGLAYFGASLLTAGVVALCGPIAFVGLLVPHTMRVLIGPSHRFLVPGCALLGMILLPLCDCIARNFLAWTTPNHYGELPVGVVTNVLGGTFFIIVLIRRPRDRPIVA